MRKLLNTFLSAFVVFCSLFVIGCKEKTTEANKSSKAKETAALTTEAKATTAQTTEKKTNAPTTQHTHSFGEWTIVEDSTCSKVGTKKRTCECGEEETETIALKEHTYDYSHGTWSWTADATNGGYKAEYVYKCSACQNEVKTAGIVTSESQDATCTVKGTTTYTAKVTINEVEYTDTKVVEGEYAAHNYREVAEVAATYEKAGVKAYYECVCGKYIKENDNYIKVTDEELVIPMLQPLKVSEALDIIATLESDVQSTTLYRVTGYVLNGSFSYEKYSLIICDYNDQTKTIRIANAKFNEGLDIKVGSIVTIENGKLINYKGNEPRIQSSTVISVNNEYANDNPTYGTKDEPLNVISAINSCSAFLKPSTDFAYVTGIVSNISGGNITISDGNGHEMVAYFGKALPTSDFITPEVNDEITIKGNYQSYFEKSELINPEIINQPLRITFDTDGGEEIKTMVVSPGTDAEGLNNIVAEKTGYTFDGWYIGETKVVAGMKVTTNVTLKAHYIAEKRTLTFELDGGTLTIGEQAITTLEVDYDTPATELAKLIPTKEHYVFAKWQLKSGETYIDIPEGAKVTANLTLKAEYELQKQTLTFELDGGTLTIGEQAITTLEVDYDTPATELAKLIPTKAGYTFVKWQLKSGETYIDIPEEAKVTANITLKAVYALTEVLLNDDFEANNAGVAFTGSITHSIVDDGITGKSVKLVGTGGYFVTLANASSTWEYAKTTVDFVEGQKYVVEFDIKANTVTDNTNFLVHSSTMASFLYKDGGFVENAANGVLVVTNKGNGVYHIMCVDTYSLSIDNGIFSLEAQGYQTNNYDILIDNLKVSLIKENTLGADELLNENFESPLTRIACVGPTQTIVDGIDGRSLKVSGTGGNFMLMGRSDATWSYGHNKYDFILNDAYIVEFDLKVLSATENTNMLVHSHIDASFWISGQTASVNVGNDILTVTDNGNGVYHISVLYISKADAHSGVFGLEAQGYQTNNYEILIDNLKVTKTIIKQTLLNDGFEAQDAGIACVGPTLTIENDGITGKSVKVSGTGGNFMLMGRSDATWSYGKTDVAFVEDDEYIVEFDLKVLSATENTNMLVHSHIDASFWISGQTASVNVGNDILTVTDNGNGVYHISVLYISKADAHSGVFGLEAQGYQTNNYEILIDNLKVTEK